jgi:FAD binding domain/Berberine and berberine like
MNFKGKIFYKDDEGYEEARVGRVFNHRRPNRFPEAVFFPEDAADVITAVKIAKEKKYKIAIRAGGHSWAAWSVRDEGILLDLKNLNHIEFDEVTKITKAQPAVKGGTELRPFLQKHGLLFPGGHCPTVGIGGFLLQGGQGWNARGWGWACEFIEGIDVVTADGELVYANATQHSDLYWAARGAGPGFFGVVVCFHLRSVPFPKALVASTYLYPVKHAQTILQWMQEIHASVSTNVEIVVIGQTVPNIPISNIPIPVIIVHVLAFENTLEEGIKDLAPFENCPVIEDAYVRRTNYITSFEEQIKLQLDANPEGHRWVVNNAWLNGSPEKVSKQIAPAFTTLPNKKAFSLWYSMAPLRTLPDMAFSLQSDIYFASYVIWENEEEDEKNKTWLKNIMKQIEPVTIGQYLGDSDFTAHQRKFIADKNFEKLQEIKKQRDPNNLFHSYLKNEDTVLNKNDFE